MAHMTTEGQAPSPAPESFLCRLGRCWSPEKSHDNSGSPGQDRHTAGCAGPCSVSTWFSPPSQNPCGPRCPAYVWVTLGQKRTLAITLPSPRVSQTAWLPALAEHASLEQVSDPLGSVIWLRTLTLTAGLHWPPSLQQGWMLLRCQLWGYPSVGTPFFPSLSGAGDRGQRF